MSPSDSAGAFLDEELLALLKDPSVAPEAIAAEMQDAGAVPLPVTALGSARAVLADLSPTQAPAIEGLPTPLRTLLLDVALANRCVDLLTVLAGSADKGMVKEAKRCLHVLRSRGMKVEAPKVVAAPTPQAHAEEQQPVYMSSIDGLGRRVVLFTGPARGGVDVAQLVLSDETGVVSAELAPLGRKAYREFLDRIFSMKNMFVVEAPRAWARCLVANALDLNASARRPVPSTFNDVAFLLGPAVGQVPSPGRALPRPEEAASHLANARQLLLVPEMATWIPPDREAEAFDRKGREITASQLLDDQQKTSALRELVSSAVEAFWTRPHRELYAGRLFDMAWLFQRAKREESAALALATASALAGDTPVSAIPFAYLLFEALLPTPQGAPELRHAAPGTGAGSLIIPA